MSLYKQPVNAVHVEVTDRCNSECPGCARSAMGGPVKNFIQNKELGIEYFTDYIGEEFCKQIKSWNFCGNLGDPSNAQDLVDIVSFLFVCNPDTRIEIRTNGGARNDKFWYNLGQQFKGKSFEKNGGVIWSIDGLEKTNHIYRKNVRWNNLWKNFESYFEGLDSNLNKKYGKWVETPINDGNEITRFYFKAYSWSNGIWDFLLFDHNKNDIDEIKNICKNYNLELRVKQPFGFPKDVNSDNIYSMPVYDRQPDENNFYKLLYTIKPFGIENVNKDHILEDHKPYMQENSKFTSSGQFEKKLIEQYISKNNYNIDISCASVSENDNFYEIFLNSAGEIYPCCFHASKLQIGEGQINNMYKDFNNTLSKDNNIQQILNSNLFTKIIPEGINGDINGNRCFTCMDSCSRNPNVAKQLSRLK